MKKKIAIGVASLLVVVLLVGFVRPGGMNGNGNGGANGAGTVSAVRTVFLARGDIASSVSATGTIYSSDSTNVYSTLSNQVRVIHVEVGDQVREGDVLAELDTKSIESSIAQKKATLQNSQQSQQQRIASAKTNLDTYSGNLQNNTDSSLINAEASLATAERNVTSAENALSTQWRKYREDRENEAEDEVLTEHRDKITDLQLKLEEAEASLEKARKSLEIAKLQAQENLNSYETTLKNEQTNYNYEKDYLELQQLEDNLADCVIKAPVSGTVTAVQAVVGSSGSGLLFVIQDTGTLKVKTNVKEYDIGTVAVGNRVTIKTDATGEREFEGTLARIAPTSTLTATGNTTDSTEAQFASEVDITANPEGLLIGMNARLSIITEEKKDVFTVPYEAVETDTAGQSYIYALFPAEDGSETYRRLPVTCGIESNLYIEIDGESLREGMQIVRTASGVDQSKVVSADGEPLPEMPAGDMRGNGQRPEGMPAGGFQGGGPGGGGGGMVVVGPGGRG